MQIDLKKFIRTIPDYPKAGILFRDITTLLQNPQGFRHAVDLLVHPFAGTGITKVAGIEARGFILGGAVAHQLSVGFLPIRKQGKLPWDTIGIDYELEYGADRLEMHTDSVTGDDRVLLVDDLVATGGTAVAATTLLRLGGAHVVGASFVIDLPDLGGASRLREMDLTVRALVAFEGD